MDSGDGTFKHISPEEAKEIERLNLLIGQFDKNKLESTVSVFQVGEELEIKSSRFKVVAIGSKFMKLRLLPKV